MAMEHIDFHISYRCTNRCLFCSSSESISRYRSHPLKTKDILGMLIRKKKDGFRSVNFTGGEPTLLSDFPRLVRSAKKLGYKIYVGTNGGRFTNKKFCLEVAPFIDEVCFSCHGDASMHDLLSGKKAAFKRLNEAMDNLLGFRISFASNTVVTKSNLDSLERILLFLVRRKIKRSLISNLAPEGRGLKNYNKLAVRLSELKSRIPALIRIADKNNTVIKFFGLPACILGKFSCCSNDFSWDARLNVEQYGNKIFFLREERCLLPTRARIKTAKCQGCIYVKICGGIFKEYLKEYGDEELVSISKQG